MEDKKNIGDNGEIIAIKYLQKNGYQIIDSNFKFGKYGEIDIIAKKDNLVVFFEVKYRNNLNFGLPEESITKSKLKKIGKTIEYYCFSKKISLDFVRFDVISILKQETSYKLTHYKNLQIC